MSDEYLSSSLQENLLVLLCFNDKAAPIIRNSVEIKLFGTKTYREVARHCYDYLDQYKKPPADHLPDMLEEELNRGDEDATLYAQLLDALGNSRNTVNEKYALDSLEKFVRQQTLKHNIIKSSELITDGKIDEAETVLNEGLKKRLAVFSPGIGLAQAVSLAFNKQVRRDVLPLGIAQLDQWDIGPARGEFHLYIGAPKSGKSWWLVHITKNALIHHQKVLYLTLELSEAQIGQRLIQSLFAMTRRKAKVPITRLQTDDLGRLLRFDHDLLGGRLSIDDHHALPIVQKKITNLRCADNLVIKQFPAGSLTVPQMKVYLDSLENQTGFIPDVLVIDYPDYMKISPDNYRHELSAIYNDLRGVAVERNVAVCVSSRSNREGAKAKMITDTHAAEDYSRIYTADTILTYTQTQAERELGLARMFVQSTRVAEKDKFVVLLSQAYPIGQYCIQSAAMGDSYWGHLEQAGIAAAGRQQELEE